MKTLKKLWFTTNQIIEKLLIWEHNCILCSCKSQQQICQDCYHSLIKIRTKPHCPRCLIYLPPKEIHCNNCKTNHFHFDRIIAAYEYAFPLDKVLHQLKYHTKIEYTRVLSQLFWNSISQQLNRLPDAIIPVPLHSSKQQQRGFNQVHELVQEFRQIHPHIPLLKIQRHKNTLPQAQLNRNQRIQNLHQAFEIKQDLTGLHLAIVDDVVTTGSTVNELAKICRNLGARQVDIWCLMRANHD